MFLYLSSNIFEESLERLDFNFFPLEIKEIPKFLFIELFLK